MLPRVLAGSSVGSIGEAGGRRPGGCRHIACAPSPPPPPPAAQAVEGHASPGRAGTRQGTVLLRLACRCPQFCSWQRACAPSCCPPHPVYALDQAPAATLDASAPSCAPAVCALVATRTDSELAGMLCGASLADFDLSFFSSSTAPQFVAQLLAQVGAAGAGRRPASRSCLLLPCAAAQLAAWWVTLRAWAGCCQLCWGQP